MQLLETALPEAKVVMPQRIGDVRGFFSEVWNAREFAAVGIGAAFVQDNHVRNPLKGTLRGLDCQMPPAAQGKLVRVTRGAIFDVAVDIRRGSARERDSASSPVRPGRRIETGIGPRLAAGASRDRLSG